MQDTKLILFEGVPGSGKTTTSCALVEALAVDGHSFHWALEEDPDHPFFGVNVRSLHREPQYDQLCLRRWRAVVDDCEHRSWVLEGCALQSTVRFMFEHRWDMSNIERYWRRFGQIVEEAGVALVYFRHDDVDAFIRGHTQIIRSSVWEKISDHVRATPRGAELAQAGLDVPFEFWTRYANLCDRLVDEATFPVLNLGVEDGWSDALPSVRRWLQTLPAGNTVDARD